MHVLALIACLRADALRWLWRVIRLGEDGYSLGPEGHRCEDCFEEEQGRRGWCGGGAAGSSLEESASPSWLAAGALARRGANARCLGRALSEGPTVSCE